MEETKMVSECKIRQLQTENEAMRNHLKLALDSLRNPIPPVTIEKRKSSLYALDEEKADSPDESPAEDKENNNLSPPSSDVEPEPDLIWEDDDTIHVEAGQIEAQEMQSHMADLLSDLSMFKRKLASDHERFRSIKTHQSRKRRRALGDVLVNE